ncbi:hypothetical protein ACSSZE_17405 [Acidithiobacillus caldus]
MIYVGSNQKEITHPGVRCEDDHDSALMQGENLMRNGDKAVTIDAVKDHYRSPCQATPRVPREYLCITNSYVWFLPMKTGFLIYRETARKGRTVKRVFDLREKAL